MRKLSSFPYSGGKFYMLNDIIEIFSHGGMTTVVDVFEGSGKFLLNADAEVKVYNDIDSRFVNLFLVIKERPEAFSDRFRYSIHSRQLFNRYLLEPETGDAVEDAYRFLYILNPAFKSRNVTVRPTFGYSLKTNRTQTADVILRNFDVLHSEIRKWTIEYLDFRELMKKYDSPFTFFYLDPLTTTYKGTSIISTTLTLLALLKY